MVEKVPRRLLASSISAPMYCPGVTMLTPPERMATLVSFRVARWPAEELRTELGRRVFAITRTVPELDALRISVGWFNTEAELDAFCGAVAELAAHTPDTLPRKPALVIVPGLPEGPA